MNQLKFWDESTRNLYYADLGGIQPTLVRYDYRKNRAYSTSIRNRTAFASFIIPIKCKKNQFAVGVGRNIEIIHWNGYSSEAEVFRTVINVESGDFYSTNSLNDGKADPWGRLFAGTERALFCNDDSSVANGTFFMYTKRDVLIQYRNDVYSSNGLTWNKRKKKFYYDWDPSTGLIRKLNTQAYELNFKELNKEMSWECKIIIYSRADNGKIAYDFRINGEFAGYTADGMTIDRDGLLWVGLFKGNSIIAVDPV